jgi:hypothetical protein
LLLLLLLLVRVPPPKCCCVFMMAWRMCAWFACLCVRVCGRAGVCGCVWMWT